MPVRLMTDTISDDPVFVFASGWRCGSTLLQRLLNSHKDVLIWGEHLGYVKHFLDGVQGLLAWERQHRSHRINYLTGGYDHFSSNMVPDDQAINDAVRGYLGLLFGAPARQLGKPTWGFKEVRYDAEAALALQALFPGARFIHITRSIVDCFLSLKRWELAEGPWNREWTLMALEKWEHVNASFLKAADRLNHVLRVKYEDMVADPAAFCDTLGAFLNLEVKDFDLHVFARRLYDAGGDGVVDSRPPLQPSDLDADERRLVAKDTVAAVAQAYGYTITV